MSKFTVFISRSATQTAEYRVEAINQFQAEDKIANKLNGLTRVDLNDISRMVGVTFIGVEMQPDDESSWELA